MQGFSWGANVDGLTPKQSQSDPLVCKLPCCKYFLDDTIKNRHKQFYFILVVFLHMELHSLINQLIVYFCKCFSCTT